MGPTASGKTALALKLCDALACDIISVDSAMVYRGMDIGTAKPDQSTLTHYPHALINIRDPWEIYSAADFVNDAKLAIENSIARNRIPLLVGGSMLYFKALQQGLAPLPKADATLRAKLENLVKTKGLDHLHQWLQTLDPITAQRIHPNDPQRLQRALEVCLITQKPLSTLQQQTAPDTQITYINIGLQIERNTLHQRIEQRLKEMFAQGFIDEVRALFKDSRVSQHLPSMKSVGYQQIWQYLAGNYDNPQMLEKALIATRQLAKRQCTWLRSWPEVHLFDALAVDLYQKIGVQLQKKIVPYG